MLSAGDPRTLRLGTAFRVAPTPTLRAELEQVLGSAVMRAPAALHPQRRHDPCGPCMLTALTLAACGGGGDGENATLALPEVPGR